MKRKLLYVILCSVFVILCSVLLNNFAQKASVNLHELPIQEKYSEVDTDTTLVLITENIPELLIVQPSAAGDTNFCEAFVLSDTLYRNYILLNNKKYLIDSLCLREYDNYAIGFQYTGTYYLSYNQYTYLIVTGFDGFQLGTDVQPSYIIFQKKETEKEYHFLSSYYIENTDYYSEEILNSVKIFFKKDKIILKGINLTRVWP
jgi:hypothetical protein